jgi:hypothetical protein
MTTPRTERLLRAACGLALCALALIVWSVLDSRPGPVMVAMTVGQVLGTLSFGAYLIVVVLELRAARLLAEEEAAAPPVDARQDGPPA